MALAFEMKKKNYFECFSYRVYPIDVALNKGSRRKSTNNQLFLTLNGKPKLVYCCFF